MCNDSSSPKVTNCTFTENIADANGGGVCNNNSSPTIVNCILWGNVAPNDPQIYNDANSYPAIAYSDIQGGWLPPPWNPDTDADRKFYMNFEIHSASPLTTDVFIGATPVSDAKIEDYNVSADSNLPWDANLFWVDDGICGTSADFHYGNDKFPFGALPGSDAAPPYPAGSPNDVSVTYKPLSHMFELGEPATDKHTWALWFNDTDYNQPGKPWCDDVNFPHDPNNRPRSRDPRTPGYVPQENFGDSTLIRYANRFLYQETYKDYWWEIRINAGKLQFRNGQGYLTVTTKQSLKDMGLAPGEWHHAAFVLDRSAETASKIYIDGLEAEVEVGAFDGSASSIMDASGNSPIRFGSGRYDFDGMLDEVRLYSRVLTSQEVSILSDVNNSNINVDPCFVNPVEGNYRLLSDSPCIDAGNNYSVPPDYANLDGDGNTVEPTLFDLDGLERFIDGDCNDSDIVDMGAYEFLSSDINHNGAVNFVDFAKFALQWFQTDCGECDGADLTCDSQVNLADLREFAEWWLAGM